MPPAHHIDIPSMRSVAIMLGLFLSLTACVSPRTSTAPAATLSTAKAHFNRGEFPSVVETLGPSREALKGSPEEPEALYLLGNSLYQGVCVQLDSCDYIPNRGIGFLTGSQEAELAAARDYLLAAGDRAPQASFAPDAFYLAARTMDYGFLQLFDRALELYRWCFTSYPDTDAAAKSRERYENILQKFRGISSGAHGE